MNLQGLEKNQIVQVALPKFRFHIPKQILGEKEKCLDLLICFIVLLKNYNPKFHSTALTRKDIKWLQFTDETLLDCLHWFFNSGFIYSDINELHFVNNELTLTADSKIFSRIPNYGLLYDFEVSCIREYGLTHNINYRSILLSLSFLRSKLNILKARKYRVRYQQISETEIEHELGIDAFEFYTDINHLVNIGVLKIETGIDNIKDKTDIAQIQNKYYVFRYRLEYFNQNWGIYFPYENIGFLNNSPVFGHTIWHTQRRVDKINQPIKILPVRTSSFAKIPYNWLYDLALTDYRVSFYAYFSFEAKKTNHKKNKTVIFSPNQIAKAIGCTEGNINRKTKHMNTYEKLKILANMFAEKNYIQNFQSRKFKANKQQEVLMNCEMLTPKKNYVVLFKFEYDFLIANTPQNVRLSPSILMSIFLYLKGNILIKQKQNSYFTATYQQIGELLGIDKIVVSTAVDFLEGSGFIKTFRKTPIKENNFWKSFPCIFVLQYHMVNDKYCFSPDCNYNCNVPLQDAKYEMGVYINRYE